MRYLFIMLACSLALTAQAQQRPESDARVRPPRPDASPVLGDLTFERYSVEDGLPHNNIVSIVQDSIGFMWLGTWGGLVRYDGTSFQVYDHEPNNPGSLSHSRGEILYIDRAGTLWVGTFGGGLNSFDPATETFKRYRHDADDPTSLSGDVVTAILEDQAGTLWIGTHSGLDRFDRETGTFTHFRHDPEDPTSLSNDQVRALYEDSRGTLWVGTGSAFGDESPPGAGGLNRFDRTQGTFTRYAHDPEDPTSLISNKVNALFEDARGTFWVGTLGNVLHKMDREGGTFERYYHDPARPGRLSRLERTSFPPTCTGGTCGVITFIDEDRAGTLWVGAYGEGLLRYDPHTGVVRHHTADPDDSNSLPSNLVWRTGVTSDGTRWIGSLGLAGLSRVVPAVELFPHYVHEDDNPNSLSHNSIWGMHTDEDGILWIATRGGGLNRFDPSAGSEQAPETGRFTHYRHDKDDPYSLSSDSLLFIHEDRSGALWIGTWNAGLNRFEKETGRVRRYRSDSNDPQRLSHPMVTAILEDRQGVLWVGTFGGGLNGFNKETGRFTHYRHDEDDPHSLSSDQVMALHEDERGTLWVSTWGGDLDRFNPAEGTFTHSSFFPSFELFEDRSGELWAGTHGGGLHRFDQAAGTSSRFTTAQGLPGDNIAAIIEDDAGHLWVSTFEGPPASPTAGRLARFDPETQSFRTIDAADGLPGIAFQLRSAAEDQHGRLYFGGPDGFIAFDPASLGERPTPQVVLTDLRLFNEPVGPGEASPLNEPIYQAEEIRLSHEQYDFTIDYAGLDYRSRSPLTYQYMLENHDADWVEARAQRSARYSRVAPGRYIFRVRAARQGGGWSAEAASIGITVLPPWWRTWWAYLLYGLLALGGVFAAGRIQHRWLIQRERERARARELEQAKEIERAYHELRQAKDRLVQQEKLASLGALTAGIAHEIKNPLNFITNFAVLSQELFSELEEALRDGNSAEVETILDHLRLSVQKIEAHGKRADGIVRSMMQHASSGSGDRQCTDVNALLEEYVNLAYHGRRAQQTGFACEIERNYDEGVGRVELVPQAIGRVFLNLLDNAFDAVQEEAVSINGACTPTVTVSTRLVDGQVEIRVGDNGPGIPATIKDKIFEPFFTTKPTRAGLGLSLAYDIVTQGHGGMLRVESIEGEGTTFVITLPHEGKPTDEINSSS